jgi:predicted MFS family arabinose efflux permease
VKRPFSKKDAAAVALLASGASLIAATYGLVRLAYGLFLPDVRAELGFDAAIAGLISSGASLVYCAGAVAGFFLAGRHPRLLVAAAAVSASVGAAGMAVSPETGVFAVFAIVGSAGAGLASPGLVSIIRRGVEASRVDRGQAIVNAGTGPGLVVAGLLALVLMPDWRLAWSIVAAVTLLVAAAVLLLDRGRGDDDAGGGHPGMPPGGWFREHGRIILATLLLGAGSAAVWNYGRSHLVEAGASATSSVAAWVALGVGGTAVIATARLAAALHPRTVWTVTTLVVAAASAALGLVPGSAPVALVACAAFGWGYTAATGGLIAWTTRIDGARAPAGTSLLFVVLVLGQAVGATAVGALVTSAGSVTAFVLAAGLVLGATAIPLAQPARAHGGRNRVDA